MTSLIRLCTRTGTIEVGGWTGPETLDLVRSLKESILLVYDLVEVMPYARSFSDYRILAGNIMFEFISDSTSKKRRGEHYE